MPGLLVLILIAYVVYLHGKLVRTGLTQAENPVFVMEQPALSRPLQATADRIELWRREGRISREEYELLTALVREDGARERGEKRGLTSDGKLS